MRILGVAVGMTVALLAGPVRAEMKVVSQGPYSPARVEQFVVQSAKLGRNFLVVVTPPGAPIVPGMKPPASGQKLAAVYALDGGYGLAGPMTQMLSMSGVTASAYVISISYPANSAQRNTDLLFRPVTDSGGTYGGGGAAFLDFLKTELRPFLETRYPLDPTRAVLVGHSFGGLFAANVLAEAPETFSGYVIGSASVWRDPTLPQRLEAVAPRAAGKRVFVAAGGSEEARVQDSARRIGAALARPGSKVKVETHIFEGANHLSYYPRLAEAGLSWVLPQNVAGRVPTAISQEAMDRVVGAYVMADGRKATIQRRGGVLIAQMTGMPGETEILAETERRFFVPGGYDVLMSFEGPERAPATALVINMGGAEMRALRAKP